MPRGKRTYSVNGVAKNGSQSKPDAEFGFEEKLRSPAAES